MRASDRDIALRRRLGSVPHPRSGWLETCWRGTLTLHHENAVIELMHRLMGNKCSRRYTAVKVSRSSRFPGRSNEAIVASHLRNTCAGTPEYNSVAELLDIFVIRGPNGFHECLVMEPVVPLIPDTQAISARWTFPTQIIRQVVQAFAFLHGQGVIHGGMW